MNCCRICGETKKVEEFFCIPRFSQYKKKNWCKKCQKLYVEMLRAKEFQEKTAIMQNEYTVSFS